jgi:glutamate-ammonia-ligase adenylyltransferase
MLDKLPSRDGLGRMLAEPCRGAEDVDPILHSFKNAQQLHVGVRDILGKEEIQATTQALSHIAEACLEQIALRERDKLVARLGEPMVEGPDGPEMFAGRPCELIILAMGKFGGAELNYHSDLDLMFLYEAEGSTHTTSRRATSTTNQHFFDELGQRIIKAATYLGPNGRLYEVDSRLRPTGRSGALTTSLAEFARYFSGGGGQLWERQALCKARVVFGSAAAASAAEETVRQAILARPFASEDAAAVREMRRRLEESAGKGDLKRGPGGLVDIEVLVQLLQLKHAQGFPQVLCPDTLGGLAALRRAEILDRGSCEFFAQSYRFLRKVESRLRLMFAAPRSTLPTEPTELARLARGMDLAESELLVEKCEALLRENRRRFQDFAA